MATVDCSACNDLQSISPAFVQNGLNSTHCTSLKNNTGLNPNLSVVHTDCEDLDTINDCLVGRKAEEIEAYDVCDWKKYMRKLVPNIWTTIKAAICAICGLWTHVEAMEDQVDAMCEKLEQVMIPSGIPYGYLPYTNDASRFSVGTVPTKSGSPIMTVQAKSEIPENYQPYAGVGLYYNKKKLVNCEGTCTNYEWIEPYFYRAYLSSNVEKNDILWYITKSEAQSKLGISDTFWTQYSYANAGWVFNLTTSSDQSQAWVRLVIDSSRMGANYLTLVYEGSSYPDHSQAGQMLHSPQGGEFRVIRSTCS